MLYTGDWGDHEFKRRQRVGWIIKYIARTFDPVKAKKKTKTQRLAWSVQLENMLPQFMQVAKCDIDQARKFIRSLLEYMHSNPENAWNWIAGRMTWFGIKSNPAKVGRVLTLLLDEGIIEIVQEWHVAGRRYGRHYRVLVAMEQERCLFSPCLNSITSRTCPPDDPKPAKTGWTRSTMRLDTS